MGHRIIEILIFLLPATLSPAQTLNGRIVDKKSGEAVIAATVGTSGIFGTITDSTGHFSLSINKVPVTLSISHIAYGLQTIEVSEIREQLMVIRLEQLITRIPEVRISGKRIQALTKKANYTVTDYEFDGPYMWMIGFLNNNPAQGRLLLCNHYGEVITTAPVQPKARLYRDLFQNIHLMLPDSVYQLLPANDSIRFLYTEATGTFLSVMGGYQTSFNRGLVALNYRNEEDVLYLIYIDSTLNAPLEIPLTKVESKWSGYLEKKYGWIARYFGERTLQLVINQQKGYYFQRMASSLFTLKDSLFVVNLHENQLHGFGPGLTDLRTVPIYFFMKETEVITDVYQPFKILTDRALGIAYVQYHINNNWRMVPLDQTTGDIGPDLPLPDFNGMDQISIHNGAVYFLYPEKNFPYYTRLFRMAIEN